MNSTVQQYNQEVSNITEFLTRNDVIKEARDVYYLKEKCDESTFTRDITLFTVVKKSVNKFLRTGIINEKLLLNNIIICLNIFDVRVVNIFFKVTCDDDCFSVIKSCLIFLNSYTHIDSVPKNRIMCDILKDMEQRSKRLGV